MACRFYARAPSNVHLSWLENIWIKMIVAGNSAGIKIHAVFVSKVSGELLQNYAGSTMWSSWLIMAISFISLLAMSAVLATCFFVRRHRIRRERPRAPRLREFHGMSSRLVKPMPSLISTAILEDNCTSRTCTICLEDYNVGENFQFQARHKFHALCVDSWLTSWRTFCPVCKRDARTCTGEPPASESTPLLSSSLISSSHQHHPLHHSESAASLSPFVSAQSLPGC
ncbi:hypothetical protein ACJRO7_007889 [Eucalyptus globulus]|uniref:RING-type domain-containing protein n=1 Tax=Eucalyptus globulus TaxID=34317 RepID=A0ABD3IPN2_EUCGL